MEEALKEPVPKDRETGEEKEETDLEAEKSVEEYAEGIEKDMESDVARAQEESDELIEGLDNREDLKEEVKGVRNKIKDLAKNTLLRIRDTFVKPRSAEVPDKAEGSSEKSGKDAIEIQRKADEIEVGEAVDDQKAELEVLSPIKELKLLDEISEEQENRAEEMRLRIESLKEKVEKNKEGFAAEVESAEEGLEISDLDIDEKRKAVGMDNPAQAKKEYNETVERFSSMENDMTDKEKDRLARQMFEANAKRKLRLYYEGIEKDGMKIKELQDEREKSMAIAGSLYGRRNTLQREVGGVATIKKLPETKEEPITANVDYFKDKLNTLDAVFKEQENKAEELRLRIESLKGKVEKSKKELEAEVKNYEESLGVSGEDIEDKKKAVGMDNPTRAKKEYNEIFEQYSNPRKDATVEEKDRLARQMFEANAKRKLRLYYEGADKDESRINELQDEREKSMLVNLSISGRRESLRRRIDEYEDKIQKDAGEVDVAAA